MVRTSSLAALLRELGPWVEEEEVQRYLSYFGPEAEGEQVLERLRQAQKPSQLMTKLNQHVVELEQQRLEEVNQRNLVIAELENRLSEEKRLRVLEMDDKARKVGELEGEIQGVVDEQLRENASLKLQLADLRNQMHAIEGLLREHMTDQASLPDMVARLVTRDKESLGLLGKADACIKHLEIEAIRLKESNHSLEAKEKQALAKIVRLRDERGRLRDCQQQLSQHLDDIFHMTSQLAAARKPEAVSVETDRYYDSKAQEGMLQRVQAQKETLRSFIETLTTSTCGNRVFDAGTQTEVRDAYFEILSILRSGNISSSSQDNP